MSVWVGTVCLHPPLCRYLGRQTFKRSGENTENGIQESVLMEILVRGGLLDEKRTALCSLMIGLNF